MAGSAIQSLPLTEEAISARLERLPLTSWHRQIMLSMRKEANVHRLAGEFVR